MKKAIIAINLVLLAILSTSCLSMYNSTLPKDHPVFPGEICFQNYLWGDNVLKISKTRSDIFFESLTPTWEDAYDISGFSSYSVGYQIFSSSNEIIAGYSTRNFKMYFVYGHDENGILDISPEESELYLVMMDFDVCDVEAAYEDLYNKLTEKYGDSITDISYGNAYSTEGIVEYKVTSTYWFGENDTGIALTVNLLDENSLDSTDWYDKRVVLSYGKTDSKKTIQSVYREYQNTLKENENQNRNTQDTNGL